MGDTYIMDFNNENDLQDLPIITFGDGFDLQGTLIHNKDGNIDVENGIESILSSVEKTTSGTLNDQLIISDFIPQNTSNLSAEYEAFARSVLTPSTSVKKNFVCSVCSKSFPEGRYLNRHLYKHTNQFKCPLCLKSFARKESQLKHVPKCKVINPEFGKRKKLNPGEPPKYSCGKCFQQFTRKENYNQHLKKHEGVQVMCESCGKTFTSVKSCLAHKKLHSSTRTLYFCYHCAAVFLFKSNLQRHLRRYQYMKNIIICDICNLRVKNEEYLDRHKSQSVKECVICSQTFCLENDLRRHRKIIHPELWFKCKLCDPKICFTARSEHHLQNHAKKAHNQSLTFMNCYEEGWYVRCD